MLNSKAKYLVSVFAIVVTSVVLLLGSKTASETGYFILSELNTPNSIPIEGCGTEYLVKVPLPDLNLQTSLEALFSVEDASISALAISDITVEVTENTINLNGELLSAGTCDTPRIQNQIEKTIEQFTTEYVITLNGSEAAYRCFGDESGMCE